MQGGAFCKRHPPCEDAIFAFPLSRPPVLFVSPSLSTRGPTIFPQDFPWKTAAFSYPFPNATDIPNVCLMGRFRTFPQFPQPLLRLRLLRSPIPISFSSLCPLRGREVRKYDFSLQNFTGIKVFAGDARGRLLQKAPALRRHKIASFFLSVHFSLCFFPFSRTFYKNLYTNSIISERIQTYEDQI